MWMSAEPTPAIELIEIPSGDFPMDGWDYRFGDPPPGTPETTMVPLAAYAIGKYPVTVAQFRAFMQDTGHPFDLPEGCEDHPVSSVVFSSAWLFAAWMRERTGKPYHVPTEAEWEKAATWDPGAGCKRAYPWGDDPGKGFSNSLGEKHKGTTPIGAYSPRGDSPYGCVDMKGNVDEWCNSMLVELPYVADDGRESMEQQIRVHRGGDWNSFPDSPASCRNYPSDWWTGLWGCRR